MADSDDEGGDGGIDLTGFLFGNIDESGQLEDDVLDKEAKRHLSSLGRLGLGSLLKEMMSTDENNPEEQDEGRIKSEIASSPEGTIYKVK